MGAMSEDQALAILRGPDPEAAAGAEAVLWDLWCQSGRPAVDAAFRRGVEALESGHLDRALALFSEVIAQAADFAEGWNKRATARYLAGDHRGAVADCEETLARNPHHFGALSGQGLCHLALSEPREAAAVFRRALMVHPHLTGPRHNLRVAISELVKGNGH
jgi:tetratricopeptide (TPR) repeat protein